MREIIPVAQSWLYFKANRRGRFQARVGLEEVVNSAATQDLVFFRVWVARGRRWRWPMGRFAQLSSRMHGKPSSQGLRSVRYVDGSDKQTEV